ncbi:MAG: hypothetical protein V4857_28510, partial [Pseudomonadota bacterium]
TMPMLGALLWVPAFARTMWWYVNFCVTWRRAPAVLTLYLYQGSGMRIFALLASARPQYQRFALTHVVVCKFSRYFEMCARSIVALT